MRVVEIFDRTKVILEITFLCSLRSLGEPVHELDMHTHKYSSTFRLPSAPWKLHFNIKFFFYFFFFVDLYGSQGLFALHEKSDPWEMLVSSS